VPGNDQRIWHTQFATSASLTSWTKLFQNLRATRQTELEDSFPSHVMCAWLGNSQQVAKKHFFNVTEDHFGRATTDETSKKQNSNRRQSAGKLSKRSGRETKKPLDIRGLFQCEGVFRNLEKHPNGR
jgi:hypothetical protein